jgi:hypothetical protein
MKAFAKLLKLLLICISLIVLLFFLVLVTELPFKLPVTSYELSNTQNIVTDFIHETESRLSILNNFIDLNSVTVEYDPVQNSICSSNLYACYVLPCFGYNYNVIISHYSSVDETCKIDFYHGEHISFVDVFSADPVPYSSGNKPSSFQFLHNYVNDYNIPDLLNQCQFFHENTCSYWIKWTADNRTFVYLQSTKQPGAAHAIELN